MGIPSGLSWHHIPLHGPVSGNHVFDGAGLHMPDMRLAVGRGRPVIKGVGGTVLSKLQALSENIVFLPEPFYCFLTVYKV